MPYRYAVGDYMRGYRGDPGIFSFLKKGIGGIIRGVGGLLPGPFGGIARTVGGAIAGRTTVARSPMVMPGRGGQMGRFTPGAQLQSISPGGTQFKGQCPAGHHMSKTTGACVPNRRMNVGNARALRRAIRRQSGFVKLARRALQGSGYRIVSKGSGRRRVNIKEAGAGSVTVQ